MNATMSLLAPRCASRPDARDAMRFLKNLADIRRTKFVDREVIEFIFTLDPTRGDVPPELRRALYGLAVVIRFGNGEQYMLETETHAFRYDGLLEQYVCSVCAPIKGFVRNWGTYLMPGNLMLHVYGVHTLRFHGWRELEIHEVVVEPKEVELVTPFVEELTEAAAK